MLGLVDNSKGLSRSENVHFDGTVAQLFLELRLLHSAGDGGVRVYRVALMKCSSSNYFHLHRYQANVKLA